MVDNPRDNPEPGRDGREAVGERAGARKPNGIRRPDGRPDAEGPDVYLNVPLLKVDEISISVENLEAHVSLKAEVLDLLRLNVGADAFLGKVNLEIKGVEAQALLEVRLDNVSRIVDRVLTTLDRNPELLQQIGRTAEEAAAPIGQGVGEAAGEIGAGAKGAVEDVGSGAGSAVGDVGETAKDAGKAVSGVAAGVGDGDTSDHDADQDQEDTGTLQGALRETARSVRDLERAVLRKAAERFLPLP